MVVQDVQAHAQSQSELLKFVGSLVPDLKPKDATIFRDMLEVQAEPSFLPPHPRPIPTPSWRTIPRLVPFLHFA